MIRKKRFLIYIAVNLVFIVNVMGQQDWRMSQYMNAPMLYNPAATGLYKGISASGAFRNQWTGFKDAEGNNIAPVSFYASVDANIPAMKGGLGLIFSKDDISPIVNNTVRLDYSYHLKLKSSTLYMGVMLGLNNQSMKFSELNPDDPSDPLLNAITKDDITAMTFDAGLGFYYTLSDKLFVGLSAIQLLNSDYYYRSDQIIYKDALQLYLSGGYCYTLKYRPRWQIQPSLLFSYSKTAFQMDVDFLVKYNKKVWAGVGYRINDAIKAMIGFDIKDLSVGYSYDITTSSIRLGGSHEITLRYVIQVNLEKSIKSYRNIRYL